MSIEYEPIPPVPTQARAGEGIESPYDIEARYRSRYGICISGFLSEMRK